MSGHPLSKSSDGVRTFAVFRRVTSSPQVCRILARLGCSGCQVGVPVGESPIVIQLKQLRDTASSVEPRFAYCNYVPSAVRTTEPTRPIPSHSIVERGESGRVR